MILAAMKKTVVDPANAKVTPYAWREAHGTAIARREVESAELLDGSRQLLIRHAGEIYTLRQTSKGKLILTK